VIDRETKGLAGREGEGKEGTERKIKGVALSLNFFSLSLSLPSSSTPLLFYYQFRRSRDVTRIGDRESGTRAGRSLWWRGGAAEIQRRRGDGRERRKSLDVASLASSRKIVLRKKIKNATLCTLKLLKQSLFRPNSEETFHASVRWRG
jgi:hypothetical protein